MQWLFSAATKPRVALAWAVCTTCRGCMQHCYARPCKGKIHEGWAKEHRRSGQMTGRRPLHKKVHHTDCAQQLSVGNCRSCLTLDQAVSLQLPLTKKAASMPPAELEPGISTAAQQKHGVLCHAALHCLPHWRTARVQTHTSTRCILSAQCAESPSAPSAGQELEKKRE